MFFFFNLATILLLHNILARHFFRVNNTLIKSWWMYIQKSSLKSRIWGTCVLIICYLTLRFYNSVVSQCLFDFKELAVSCTRVCVLALQTSVSARFNTHLLSSSSSILTAVTFGSDRTWGNLTLYPTSLYPN